MSTSFLIESLLIGEHLIPDVAAAAEGLLKQLRLGRGGIEPDLEGGEANGFAVLRFHAFGFLPRHDSGTSSPGFFGKVYLSEVKILGKKIALHLLTSHREVPIKGV